MNTACAVGFWKRIHSLVFGCLGIWIHFFSSWSRIHRNAEAASPGALCVWCGERQMLPSCAVWRLLWPPVHVRAQNSGPALLPHTAVASGSPAGQSLVLTGRATGRGPPSRAPAHSCLLTEPSLATARLLHCSLQPLPTRRAAHLILFIFTLSPSSLPPPHQHHDEGWLGRCAQSLQEPQALSYASNGKQATTALKGTAHGRVSSPRSLQLTLGSPGRRRGDVS